MRTLEKDNISRLAIAFLEKDPNLWQKHGDAVFEIIGQQLACYTLKITCTAELENSVTQQAALLTAINVGRRCYKGGVFIECTTKFNLLLPWPSKRNLGEAINELGGKVWQGEKCSVEIKLGTETSNTDCWNLLVNAWAAGVVPPGISLPPFHGNQDFVLGGILGGAIAVGLTFLKIAGFDYSIGHKVLGLSLWRPDLSWNDPMATGPTPRVIPDKYWLIGLGHLGQAYAWLLGLMPYKDPGKVQCILQDFDRVVWGNLDAAMLCTEDHIGQYKTRVVSAWLKKRGIESAIIERPYRPNFPTEFDDPVVILGGLDNLAARKALPVSQGQLLLDIGLGGGVDFDLIRLHIFPNNELTPATLWKTAHQRITTPELKKITEQYMKCGFTLGIASAFTGCVAATLAISELLRSTMQGIKLKHAFLSIRELTEIDIGVAGYYKHELLCRTAELSTNL